MSHLISPSEKIALLQRLTLFADLPSTACAAIRAEAQEKRFWRHHTIFSQGDPIEQVVMLLSGCAKITQVGLNGDEVIFRLIVKGEIVGDFQPTTEHTHNATGQAVETCMALVWQMGVFQSLLDSFPIFRRNLVRALEARLHELEQRFRELSSEYVASRLSSELIRLSHRIGQDGNGKSRREIRLSRKELAQLTGTTLATVSRLLCAWQRRGIVRIRRQAVEVHDFVALTQIEMSE